MCIALLINDCFNILIDCTSGATTQCWRKCWAPCQPVQALEYPRIVGQIVGHAPIKTETIVGIVGIANDADSEANSNLSIEKCKKSEMIFNMLSMNGFGAQESISNVTVTHTVKEEPSGKLR